MQKYVILFVIIYLIIINLAAIIATISDKSRAKRRAWRIPESTLLLLSLLGGSISMLITMLTIRHKTKHLKFMLGIPAIIVLQIAIIVGAVLLL